MIFWFLLAASAASDAICMTTEYDPYGPNHSLSDYCPNAPHCKNSSHILCEYGQDSYYSMSTTCTDPINIRLPEHSVDLILDLLSALRSKLAMGKEIGLHQKTLPKAYGLMRIEWDHQLATYAQIKANQCVYERDHCHSTYRFPDPGQLIGKLSEPFKHNHIPMFTINMLEISLRALFQNWYEQRKNVSREIILFYHNSTHHVNYKNEGAWKYLQLVYHQLTHIGCGVSAFTIDGRAYDKEIVLVVCNFSATPVEGKPVYQVKRPAGSDPVCGCLSGFTADNNCLCYPVPLKATETTKKEGKFPKKIVMPIVINKDRTTADRTKDRDRTVGPAAKSCEEECSEESASCSSEDENCQSDSSGDC